MGLGEAGVHALDSILVRTGSLCVSKVEILYTDAKSLAHCLLDDMAGKSSRRCRSGAFTFISLVSTTRGKMWLIVRTVFCDQ